MTDFDEFGLSADQRDPLASVLYRLLERHDASPDVLCIIGSLFDTLPTVDVIEMAEDWLKTGETLRSAQ